MDKKSFFSLSCSPEWLCPYSEFLFLPAANPEVAAGLREGSVSPRDLVIDLCPGVPPIYGLEQEGGFRGDSTNGPADGV